MGADPLWVWGRLALAIVCVGALMAARWHHERQLASAPRAAQLSRTWLERKALEARTDPGSGTRLARRLPPVTHPLYWLGLTTSAALAAQAIATLLTPGQ